MDKVNKNITLIRGDANKESYNDLKVGMYSEGVESVIAKYRISYNDGDSEVITIELPEDASKRVKILNIVDENNKFVNGYKRVKNEYGQTLYIRQKDNKLLWHVFDIGFDFNEYGYAMVGKNGVVSWINEKFEYFTWEGEFVKDNLEDYYNFKGWTHISQFSEGNIPLSMCRNNRMLSEVGYLRREGRLKTFYQFDGKECKEKGRSKFDGSGSQFNKQGYAIVNSKVGGNYILFDKGYCISFEDAIDKFIGQDGIETIRKTVEEKEAFQKVKNKINGSRG